MLLRKAPLAAGRCRLLHLKQRNGTATSGFATSQRPQQQQKQQVNPQSQHVTAPVFAGLLKKSGLSQKKLHALYAGEGSSAPDGEFPIAVALSGGADSMALTLLLREYLQQQRIRTPLLAITVDHRLRVESTEEAQEIGRIVKDRWDIEHVIAQCAWAADEGGGGRHASNQLLPPKPRGSKLQEEARRYRYALLQQICREKRVRCLFVAHNLGDQLETVLFRLGRASGINGLAGIASVSPLFAEDDTTAAASEEVTLMRPLLSISKPQLKETCKRFKQQWVEDPSNEKLQFDRIRIRKELERLEAERGPEVLQLFSSLQQNAAKAKKEFARAERRIFRKYMVKREPDHIILQMAFLDDEQMFDELSIRVVSEIVMDIGNKDTPPRLASISRLVDEVKHLESGKQLTLGGCRITKKLKGQHLHFQPERQQRKSARK